MNHYHDSWSTFVHTWHGLLSRFFSSNPELSGPRAVILVFFEIFEKEFLRSFLLLHSSGTEKNQIRNHHLSLGHHRSTCRVAPELPELPGETALERLEAALGPQARLLATSAEAADPPGVRCGVPVELGRLGNDRGGKAWQGDGTHDDAIDIHGPMVTPKELWDAWKC